MKHRTKTGPADHPRTRPGAAGLDPRSGRATTVTIGYDGELDEALTMILEVQITDPMTGASRKMRFSHSPVRIGRNQLNDLSLDTPFVSEWHGTIRFDNHSVAYFDLGSTNGSMLDGKRLTKNVAVELTDSSRLQVGGVELAVTVQQAEGAFNKTLGWGRPEDAPERSDRPAPAPAPAVVRSPERSRAGSSPPFARANPGHAPAAPSTPASPSAFPSPSGYSSPGGQAAPGYAGQGGYGHVNPSGGPALRPQPGEESAAGGLVARQRQLLEAFAESFVGLRKGYEQFGAEVGVRTVSGTTALHRARTSAELLDYLLQPNLDPAAASRELIAIFADLGIHHIAMMEAITEGVRAVLQSLDPRVNDLDAGAGLLSRGKTKAQWKSYLDRFDQLVTDDDELHTAIFSDEFARAYASVTLGDSGTAVRRKKEDKE
jgi:type VI secretion system protein ImpI